MRVGDNISPLLQNLAAILWGIALGLNFIFAISPTWGWHPFLGWSSSVILLVIAIDEKKVIVAALIGRAKRADKLFSLYLLIISVVAFLVNAVLTGILFIE